MHKEAQGAIKVFWGSAGVRGGAGVTQGAPE